MTSQIRPPYARGMQKIAALLSVMLLAGCASQKPTMPKEEHAAGLPASFARPPTAAELALQKSLEKRSLRAHGRHGNQEHCLSRDSAPHQLDFRSADTNKDKKVSRAEFNCEALSWFGHADPDRNRRLHIKKHAHRDHHAELSRHDSRGKGELNVVQFLAAMDRRFARADRNRDGALDEKEFAAGRLAPLAKGGR